MKHETALSASTHLPKLLWLLQILGRNWVAPWSLHLFLPPYQHVHRLITSHQKKQFIIYKKADPCLSPAWGGLVCLLNMAATPSVTWFSPKCWLWKFQQIKLEWKGNSKRASTERCCNLILIPICSQVFNMKSKNKILTNNNKLENLTLAYRKLFLVNFQ